MIDLLAAKVAIILNSKKSIEEKRKFFNVEGDLNQDEIADIEKQNKEAEELYKDDIEDY